MSTRKLKNINVAKFEGFLDLALCKYIHDNKGHVQYTRADLTRPIVFQNHITPVPEFIIRNALRALGYSKNDFFDILEGKKEVERESNIFTIKTVKK